MMNKDNLLTIDEVIKITTLGRTTIHNHLRMGTFPLPIKMGLRKNRWRQSDIQEWMDSRESGVYKPWGMDNLIEDQGIKIPGPIENQPIKAISCKWDVEDDGLTSLTFTYSTYKAPASGPRNDIMDTVTITLPRKELESLALNIVNALCDIIHVHNE